MKRQALKHTEVAEDGSSFDRFEQLAARLFAVPKAEVDAASTRRRRTPKRHRAKR